MGYITHGRGLMGFIVFVLDSSVLGVLDRDDVPIFTHEGKEHGNFVIKTVLFELMMVLIQVTLAYSVQ